MQPHMQAVRRCRAEAEARGGDLTYNHKDMLANQRPEELLEKGQKQQWHSARGGSLTMKLSYFWNIKLMKSKKNTISSSV